MNPTPEEKALVQPGNTDPLPNMAHPDRAVAPTMAWLKQRLDRPVYAWLEGEVGADTARSLRKTDAIEKLVGAWAKQELGGQELDEQERAALDRNVPWKAKLLDQLGGLTRAETLLIRYVQQRDAFDLSRSLAPLANSGEDEATPEDGSRRKLGFTDAVFGIGVVGMTLSSITLLMLISGFVICEMLGLPPRGWPNRLGALAAATGVLGPFLWSTQARFWLVVPTSVFCSTLLPIAYVTFFLMMNSKSLLKDDMPRGGRRVVSNLLMGVAVVIASALSLWVVWLRGGYGGLGAIGAFVLLAVLVHFVFPRNAGAKK